MQIKIKNIHIKLGIYSSILLVLAILLFVCGNNRTPFISKYRSEVNFLIFLSSVIGISLTTYYLKKKLRIFNIEIDYKFKLVVLSSLILALSMLSVVQINFMYERKLILSSNNPSLEIIGEHFIIGYKDYNEIQELVEKKAIGGIYVTKRNFKNKTVEEFKSEIDSLQEIRTEQNLPPLLIAADHEGGLVSRLHLNSLVTDQDELSTVLNQDGNYDENEKNSVKNYANIQAKDLNNLGINLNFAPVIDLKYQGINTINTASKISLRAIGYDPLLVSEVGITYSQILEDSKVLSTLKHFPGLGRQIADTHTRHRTVLDLPIEDFENNDLIPFKEITRQSNSLIMLSHTIVPEIGEMTPISFSKEANNYIRKNVSNSAVLVTDDFTMNTVYRSKYGIKEASLMGLNAGTDLILISYDPEHYYDVMSYLLENKDKIDNSKLDESKMRLNSITDIIDY